jgi:hypothetical protein
MLDSSLGLLFYSEGEGYMALSPKRQNFFIITAVKASNPI